MLHSQSKVLMLHFIYFNGFLTIGGEKLCCGSSISRVVKRKIVHFVNKVSNFFFGTIRFNLKVVSKISNPPDDVIMTSFGTKRLKNKSYEITFTLIQLKDLKFNFKHFSTTQLSVKTIFSRYIASIALQSRGLCESANAVVLDFPDSYFPYILKSF